jgi:hypothetical protein
MPFKSTAQQGFLEAHPEKIGGREKLKEWEASTDFSKLPEHVAKWEASTDFSKLPEHVAKDHPLHKLRARPKRA